MTDTIIQSPPETKPFSIDTAKAEITLKLTKEGLAYQQLLQEAENVVFSKDNLNDERTPLTKLRKIKTKLEDIENPYTAQWKGFNEAKKSLLDPVLAVLNTKTNEYKKLANEIEADRRRVEVENQRVAGIKTQIDTFILNTSQAIANASTASHLVAIEKLIGSNKGNATRYAEFLPDLQAKCDGLIPLIKKQKEAIKHLELLKQKEKDAEANGDDQAVLDSRESQEAITQRIDENKILVQESAINSALTGTGTAYVSTVAPEAPRPRRTVWRSEIIDKELAVKKSMHLLDITLNSEKVNSAMRVLKDAGLFEGKTEYIVNGIRYYEEKSY